MQHNDITEQANIATPAQPGESLHSKIAYARQALEALVKRKMSTYSNQLLWNTDNTLREIDPADPEDIQLVKHTLFALAECEELVRTDSFLQYTMKPYLIWNLKNRIPFLQKGGSAALGACCTTVLAIAMAEPTAQIDTDNLKAQFNDIINCYFRPSPPKFDDLQIALSAKPEDELEQLLQQVDAPRRSAFAEVFRDLADKINNVPALLETSTHPIPKESAQAISNLIRSITQLTQSNPFALEIVDINSFKAKIESITACIAAIRKVAAIAPKNELRQSLDSVLRQVKDDLLLPKINARANLLRAEELARHLKPGALIDVFQPILSALQIFFVDHSIYIENPYFTESSTWYMQHGEPTTERERAEHKEHGAAITHLIRKDSLRLAIGLLKNHDLVVLLKTAKDNASDPASAIDKKNRLAMIIAGINGYNPEDCLVQAHRLACELAEHPDTVLSLLQNTSLQTTDETKNLCRELALQLVMAGFVKYDPQNPILTRLLFSPCEEACELASSLNRSLNDFLMNIEIDRIFSVFALASTGNHDALHIRNLFFALINSKKITPDILAATANSDSPAGIPALIEALSLRATTSKDTALNNKIALFLGNMALKNQDAAKHIFTVNKTAIQVMKNHCLTSNPRLYYRALLNSHTLEIDWGNCNYDVILDKNKKLITELHNIVHYCASKKPESVIEVQAKYALGPKNPKAVTSLCALLSEATRMCTVPESRAEKALAELYSAIALCDKGEKVRVEIFEDYAKQRGAPLLHRLKIAGKKNEYFKKMQPDLIDFVNGIHNNLIEQEGVLEANPIDKKWISLAIRKIQTRISYFTTLLANSHQALTPEALLTHYKEIDEQRTKIATSIRVCKRAGAIHTDLQQVRQSLQAYVDDRKGSFLHLFHLSAIRREKVLLAQDCLKFIDGHLNTQNAAANTDKFKECIKDLKKKHQELVKKHPYRLYQPNHLGRSIDEMENLIRKVDFLEANQAREKLAGTAKI